MALCGKGAPGNVSKCATGADWKEYFALYNGFIGALMKMQKQGLGVEFVLDGDLGSDASCFTDLWKPWIITWTLQPAPAYLYALGIAVL